MSKANLDESSHRLTDVAAALKVSPNTMSLCHRLLDDISAALAAEAKTVVFRVNDRGVTAFIGDPAENRAFMYITLSPQHVSVKYYLDGKPVDGLTNANWNRAGDELGSEAIRITNADSISDAVKHACVAHNRRAKLT